MAEKKGEIAFYAGTEMESLDSFYLKDNSLWLTRKQMSEIFNTDVTSVGRHIQNIYDTKELLIRPTKTIEKIEQNENGRKVTRKITLYNLDMIISVGYRINSKRGTQFRIWATKILRERLETNVSAPLTEAPVDRIIKLIGGIAQRRELEQRRLGLDETHGLLQVIIDYSKALQLLDDFDHQKLQLKPGPLTETQPITYEDALNIVDVMKQQYGESTLFGNEKDESLRSSLSNIFQTFGGKELYPTFFEKAANLLYFLSKNHSFTDGNKRIAAAIFISFLHKNRMLHDVNGGKKVSDDTLVALTLLAAESDPSDRSVIVNVIISLLQGVS